MWLGKENTLSRVTWEPSQIYAEHLSGRRAQTDEPKPRSAACRSTLKIKPQ